MRAITQPGMIHSLVRARRAQVSAWFQPGEHADMKIYLTYCAYAGTGRVSDSR